MILQAAWVLPIAGPPIPNGMIDVCGDRIVSVTPSPQPPPGDVPIQNLGDAIITPGLVNPHTHLELTGYAGRLPPAPLWDWFVQLMKLRDAPGQVERERQGVQEGAWQSLRAGVTCVGDISRLGLNWRVLKPIPIRKVCFIELLTLAADPPRTVDELRAAVMDVEEDQLLTAGISPHAPYTVPQDQIRAAIQLAHNLHRPWCTHWAETTEERAFLQGDEQSVPDWLSRLAEKAGVQSPRQTAVDSLTACSAALRPGAIAHYNYAAPGDAERLAAAGHVVMYCCRAHQFFGHPQHPYRELLQAGVPVAVGTDSAASNESLAILDELRFLRRRPNDCPPPASLLEMATINGARALGLQDTIGTLTPGKQADLAAFPCPPHTDDPSAFLVTHAPAPTHVWVAGENVF